MRNENIKLFTGIGLGFLAGFFGYHYSLKRGWIFKNISSIGQVNFMLTLFNIMNNDAQEALIVRTSEVLKVNMFGKRFYDSVTPTGKNGSTRTSIEMQVYSTGVGAAGAFATYYDKGHGLMLAVVVDKNKQKKSEEKILTLPAGFMHHAIPTSNQFLTRQPNMDAFEIALLKNEKQSYQSSFETKPIPYSVDLKRINTMIRELKEETGLEVNPESAQRIADQEHIIGNKTKHAFPSFFQIDLNIKISDFPEIEKGVLQLFPSNTDEIEAAYLIPINSFSIDEEEEAFITTINGKNYKMTSRDSAVVIEGCRRLNSQQNGLNIKETILNTSFNISNYITPLIEIDSQTQKSYLNRA